MLPETDDICKFLRADITRSQTVTLDSLRNQYNKRTEQILKFASSKQPLGTSTSVRSIDMPSALETPAQIQQPFYSNLDADIEESFAEQSPILNEQESFSVSV